MTGIPVEDLEKDDSEKLLKMEEFLSRRVIGQKEAIESVSKAIRRSRVGLGKDDKPNGSFIFLGPLVLVKLSLPERLRSSLVMRKSHQA